MSDELAKTATAPASASSPRPAPREVGETLGRYRIERELGAGGMGVVYAAFDPDLERRVALKVLAPGVAGTAEQRLLREARAMARLAHGNVVAVYEVGSAGGRDFIAMELVDGTSLVDWLRATPRSEAEIVDAFVQAGRGLGAAHAAGVIHRDFKPHNVLRSRDARVAVTDFGLAREASDPLAVTAPLAGTPSSLSALTQAGAMIGTPAYMAPEQWRGERLTPATDQFAFCVALWEALAGARPYDGTTVEALRDRILAGPEGLDDAKLPRRLRRVLRRGLDPEPSKRWPSMAALLARIQRGERRPGVALAIVVGALAIAAALVFASRGRESAAVAEACPVPALDPTPTDAQIRELGPNGWDSAGLLRRLAATWHRERERACALPAAERPARLACLDRIALRNDAARQARVLAMSKLAHLRSLIAEPAMCAVADPPKLPASYSPHAITAMALLGGSVPPERTTAAREAAPGDPCARAYLGFASAGASPREADDARNAASLCGDDYLYAATTIISLRTRLAAVLAPDVQQRLAEAERAVARTQDRQLQFDLQHARAELAFVNQDIDKAIAMLDAAGPLAELPEDMLEVAFVRAVWLVNRARPDDLARVRAEALAGRITARSFPGGEQLARRFELADATAQWKQGDVEAAHPRLLALLESVPPKPAEKRTLSGVVVDAAGRPVAGATVAAGQVMLGDSVGIATPMIDSLQDVSRQLEIVTTDAKGAFTLQRAPAKGAAIAQLGALRSRPVAVGDAPLRLVLGPTTRVSGRVTLHGPRTTDLTVGVVWDVRIPYWLQMPVRDDGTFEITGVSAGATRIGVWRSAGTLSGSTTLRPIRIARAPVTGIVLDTATRALRVLLRSSTNVPLSGGLVFVMSGSVRPKTVADVAAMADAQNLAVQTPVSVIGERPVGLPQFRTNDLVATFDAAPPGAATVCAFGFQGELADKAYFARIQAAMTKRPEVFPLSCTAIAAKDATVVVDVPAMKRLD